MRASALARLVAALGVFCCASSSFAAHASKQQLRANDGLNALDNSRNDEAAPLPNNNNNNNNNEAAVEDEPEAAEASSWEGYTHRRLSATTVSLPGYVKATNYAKYINSPGTTATVVANNGIGNILKGEQATYNVRTSQAGYYVASYWQASTSPQDVSAYLVMGQNCYKPRVSSISLSQIRSGQISKYVARPSNDSFYLAAGYVQITVCFTRWPGYFGGLTIAKAPANSTDESAQGPPSQPQQTYPLPDSNGCYSEAVWESVSGEVRLNGQKVHIKGTSWYGFDTNSYNLNGLNKTSVPEVLDILKSHGINLLRLPVSLNLSINFNQKSFACGKNGKNCVPSQGAWDQMAMVMDEAALRGMLVVMDMHCLSPSGNADDFLWYNDFYTEEDFMQGWGNIVSRFKNKPNFIGVDIFNEPHAGASWGIGRNKTDFGMLAARTIEYLDDRNRDYKGLYFVEGTQKNFDTPVGESATYNHWWGGALEGIYRHDVNTSFTGQYASELILRTVYSPHVYGPSVFNQTYFNVTLYPNYPDNMPAIWDVQLGYIERVSGGRAVVIGEWGGAYQGADKILQDKLAKYLVAKCLDDQIWWAVNPNALHTGGLLQSNWRSVDKAKIALIGSVQPYPTSFTQPIQRNRWCVDWGEYGNPACKGGSSTS